MELTREQFRFPNFRRGLLKQERIDELTSLYASEGSS